MRLRVTLLAVSFDLLLASVAGSSGTQSLPAAFLKSDAVFVAPARLESHVRTMSQTLVPRNSRRPDNLDRVAAYIGQEFAQARGRVAEQPYLVNGKTYRNVIAAFGPETWERIVVGAHYDAAGPHPGADDNASGIAGLLELAHLLAAAELPITVELVAYALEEPPFFLTEQMGSAVHARSLQEEGVVVLGMLSLDMIGYFSDADDSQQFPFEMLSSLFFPNRGDFITIIGKTGQGWLVKKIEQAMAGASSLPVCAITAPRYLAEIDLSDHLNYWNADYAAVLITDTAFYRNPHYHTAADKADTLDYQRMAQVVAGVYAAVIELAR